MRAKLLRKLSLDYTYTHWLTTNAVPSTFQQESFWGQNIRIFVEDLGNAIRGVLTTNTKDTKLAEVTEDI